MKNHLRFASLGLLMAASAQAAVSYSTSGSSYTQTFDFVGAGASNTTIAWANDSTLAGWYASINGGAPTLLQRASNNVSNTVNNGTTPNGSTQYSQLTGNRADASATDYALGSFNAFGTGANYLGVRFTNSTGSTLTTFTLSYTGEQWLQKASSGADPLTFSYSVGATSLTSGTYTSASSLDFLDLGAGVPVTTSITATITGINWTNGTDLWLRWTDLDASGGTDGNKAIDNLTFSAVPEPSSAGLIAAGLGLVALRRRRSHTA